MTMELLDKRIGENTKDAEAQFLLGSCYVHTGNLSGAGYQLKTGYFSPF